VSDLPAPVAAPPPAEDESPAPETAAASGDADPSAGSVTLPALPQLPVAAPVDEALGRVGPIGPLRDAAPLLR
jgi:hypothetical protein